MYNFNPNKVTCCVTLFGLKKNMKILFITSYMPNSKFKLHRIHKSCCTYELQYTHFFFSGKDWTTELLLYINTCMLLP